MNKVEATEEESTERLRNICDSRYHRGSIGRELNSCGQQPQLELFGKWFEWKRSPSFQREIVLCFPFQHYGLQTPVRLTGTPKLPLNSHLPDITSECEVPADPDGDKSC
eukprot:12940321-Heterocapsa_arctica.AAC.1